MKWALGWPLKCMLGLGTVFGGSGPGGGRVVGEWRTNPDDSLACYQGAAGAVRLGQLERSLRGRLYGVAVRKGVAGYCARTRRWGLMTG